MPGDGNPNHDAQGRFASGSSSSTHDDLVAQLGKTLGMKSEGSTTKTPGQKPVTWKGPEYKASSASAEEHANRAAYHRERAAQSAANAKAAKDPTEAKAHAIMAATSAKHAQTCANRTVKEAAKNPTDESARHVGRALASAKAAKAHADEAAIASGVKPGSLKKEPKSSAKILKQDESAITIHGEKELVAVSAKVKSLSNSDLDKLSNATHQKLSSEERSAVAAYTGSSYIYINGKPGGARGLRNPPPSEQSKKQIAHLDEAMKKDSATTDMLVYRTVGSGMKDHKFKVGETFTDPAYLSTTNNSGMHFSSGVKLHIHVPKGHPLLHVGDHSSNEGEGEIILPRGTKLKILSSDGNNVHARIAA